MAHALKNMNTIRKQVMKAAQCSIQQRFIHKTDYLNGLRSKHVAPIRREFKRRADYLKSKGLFPETIRSKFIEWNYDTELHAFGSRLGEEFDGAFLREALMDHSYVFDETEKLKKLDVQEVAFNLKSNKELSAAGKAIIEDFCTKYLRYVWPLLPEEGIGKVVDYLISDEALGRIGNGLGLKDIILTKEYPPSECTYAKTFAAIVAALNASSGLEKTQKFVLDFVISDLIGKDIWDVWKVDEPVYLLQDIFKRSGRDPPEPRIIGELGTNTLEAVFEVGFYSDKKFIGKGYGESISIAIQVASLDSLSRLFEQTSSKEPLQFNVLPDAMGMHTSPNTSIKEWTLDRFQK